MPPSCSAQVPRTNADKSIINLRCRLVSTVALLREVGLLVVFTEDMAGSGDKKGRGRGGLDGEHEEREGGCWSWSPVASTANFCLRLVPAPISGRSKLAEGRGGRGKSRELGVTSMRPCGWLAAEVSRSPGDEDGAKTHTARAHWRL